MDCGFGLFNNAAIFTTTRGLFATASCLKLSPRAVCSCSDSVHNFSCKGMTGPHAMGLNFGIRFWVVWEWIVGGEVCFLTLLFPLLANYSSFFAPGASSVLLRGSCVKASCRLCANCVKLTTYMRSMISRTVFLRKLEKSLLRPAAGTSVSV